MSNIKENLEKVKKASYTLVNLKPEKINRVLLDLTGEIIKEAGAILYENRKDLAKMDESDPKYDRLQITMERINGIVEDVKKVAGLESPLDRVIEERALENGLKLSKVSVPLGVIGVVYEARPNVTLDVFSLCFKSGNACVLKGGSDAHFSNTKIVQLIKKVLKYNQLDENLIYLAPSEREAVTEILTADKYIDVVIPRGSQSLIEFVRKNSTIPVIETGAGIVHTYFDEAGDLEMGKNIVLNAKTRRPTVCNALDTLLIHKSRLLDLPELVAPLKDYKVEIFADELAMNQLKGSYDDDGLLHPATEDDFGKEFLSLKMSVKTVDSLEEAVEHITKYSSKHSEAIISGDKDNTDYFLKNIDSACVYVNTSTAFTDGAQFGMGAEIGISTQKLHARGPMGLRELTSYKWIILGNGQTRA